MCTHIFHRKLIIWANTESFLKLSDFEYSEFLGGGCSQPDFGRGCAIEASRIYSSLYQFFEKVYLTLYQFFRNSISDTLFHRKILKIGTVPFTKIVKIDTVLYTNLWKIDTHPDGMSLYPKYL